MDETKEGVLEMLKQNIRPEFLNRIDEIIMFLPLTEDQIKKIVVLQINQVEKLLQENGLKLELSDKALAFLATKGYNPEFGARPVKRAIQRYLLNSLSKKILAQEVDKDKPIKVDQKEDNLVFEN